MFAEKVGFKVFVLRQIENLAGILRWTPNVRQPEPLLKV
jgi:hypothetical protein